MELNKRFGRRRILVHAWAALLMPRGYRPVLGLSRSRMGMYPYLDPP